MSRPFLAFIWTMLTLLLGPAVAQQVTWFQVGPLDDSSARHETFLLPLKDPQHIADARSLVANGPGHGVGSIVNALIAPGSDGFNRDLDAPGTPLWNWHVVFFSDFSDSAIEICDGWPGFIEEDPQAFVLNTGNSICLWSYTVVAEVAVPAYGPHPGLSGAWYDPSRSGQGLFLSIEDRRAFVGWFTFDALPTTGPSGQRWYTASGPVRGSSAELELYRTTGGRFDAPDPVVTSEPGEVGTLELRFEGCNRGTAHYRLVNGPERIVPLRRLPAVLRC